MALNGLSHTHTHTLTSATPSIKWTKFQVYSEPGYTRDPNTSKICPPLITGVSVFRILYPRCSWENWSRAHPRTGNTRDGLALAPIIPEAGTQGPGCTLCWSMKVPPQLRFRAAVRRPEGPFYLKNKRNIDPWTPAGPSPGTSIKPERRLTTGDYPCFGKPPQAQPSRDMSRRWRSVRRNRVVTKWPKVLSTGRRSKPITPELIWERWAQFLRLSLSTTFDVNCWKLKNILVS